MMDRHAEAYREEAIELLGELESSSRARKRTGRSGPDRAGF